MPYFIISILLFITACSVIQPDVVDSSPKCQSTIYSAYQATVLGYCQAEQANLVEYLPVIEKQIEIRPLQEIPEVFWFNKTMRYSLVKQIPADETTAMPVIFIIAGTGASYQSAKMITLQKIFYQLGYHVVSLSSPTYANFIVNSNTSTNIPGDLANDAEALYQIMQSIWQQISTEHQLTASSFSLTGYSLGGAHSAYVSLLDETKKIFNFQDVMLLNPPLNLYNSISILDSYFDLKNNRLKAREMIKEIIDRFSFAYANQLSSNFDQEAIYQLFNQTNLSEEELQLLIGAAFRLSSSDMIFALDVMYNSGMVTYKNHTINKYESLTHSLLRASEVSFGDYFEDVMIKRAQTEDATVTKEKLIERLSLTAIGDYLTASDKIHLITNADDIILQKGEIEQLENIFAKRAKIFPRGGHCGNYDTLEFVQYLHTLLADKQRVITHGVTEQKG